LRRGSWSPSSRTDHFDFADYKKAYEYIDAHRERAMKVMIVLDK